MSTTDSGWVVAAWRCWEILLWMFGSRVCKSVKILDHRTAEQLWLQSLQDMKRKHLWPDIKRKKGLWQQAAESLNPHSPQSQKKAENHATGLISHMSLYPTEQLCFLWNQKLKATTLSEQLHSKTSNHQLRYKNNPGFAMRPGQISYRLKIRPSTVFREPMAGPSVSLNKARWHHMEAGVSNRFHNRIDRPTSWTWSCHCQSRNLLELTLCVRLRSGSILIISQLP